MLIIFGGLPGTGKSTIACALAKKVKAVYLRIDTIETAIKNSSLKPIEVEDAGYLAAFELAKDNLSPGHIVVADSVNPIPLSRESWHDVAESSNSDFVEVEIFCSDKEEHQKRVENRNVDIEGLTAPTWEQVQNREYHDWDLQGLRLDSSKLSADECVEKVVEYLSSMQG